MDKVMELLEQLATQLGVAVEYLWTTLVKQQYVEGVTNIVMATIGVISTIVLLCILLKATRFLANRHKELVEDRKKNGTGFNGSYETSSYAEDAYNLFHIAVPVIGYIAILFIVLGISNDIKDGIQQLLNPDYFALKEVLDVISGSAQ